MDINWSELKKGLLRTSRYLLSHHEQSELHRCHSPLIFGRPVHICARCSGIYPGILFGFFSSLFVPAEIPSLILVGVLPLPALVDWSLTAFTDRRGSNAVRTVTGGLLGYGYGLGLMLVVLDVRLSVFAIGLAYGCIAAPLLWIDLRG